MQRTLSDGSYASYDADESEGVYPVTGLPRPEVTIEELERLLRPVESKGNDDDDDDEQPCPTCLGTGEVGRSGEEGPCGTCGGTGKW